MQNVSHSTSARKPLMTTRQARDTAALLTTIAAALDGDGSTVEPGSVDTQGMYVVAGCFRWRLDLSEPELIDSVEWDGPECYDCQGRYRGPAMTVLVPDRDWMSDTGQDIEF